MSALRQLRIGHRLGMGFGVVLLMLCLLGGFGIFQMNRINYFAADLGTNWLPTIKLLGDIRANFNQVRRVTLDHVLEEGNEKKAALTLTRQQALERGPKLMKQYEPLIASPEERKIYEEIQTRWAAYLEQDKKLLDLSDKGEAGFALARELATSTSAIAFNQAMEAIQRDVDLNVAGGDTATANAASSYSRALWISLVVIALAVLIGVVLAALVTRSITEPLEAGVRVAETVASGDLTSRFEVVGQDEPAVLLRALQNMNGRLVDIVGQVRLASDSIATGSAEIATGNADLSQRTEEQASNLEQTAASMEELNSTVKTNADTARQASALASNASHAAEQGGSVVNQVVSTMQDITASSRKIADIIGVIDGIAFQTNILALNAAVEAARAGEQGRGFAVVASEVRSLAGRSADAAREIKTLINASVEKVDAGSRLVDEAGASMQGIVSQVRQVSTLINEISNASLEQSSGIEQIGNAVNQLDQVTQQNAALVEQSAAAADSLKQQSLRLAELVGVFKLDGMASGLAPRPAAVTRPKPVPARMPAPGPTPRKPSASLPKAGAKLALSSAGPAASSGDNWESF